MKWHGVHGQQLAYSANGLRSECLVKLSLVVLSLSVCLAIGAAPQTYSSGETATQPQPAPVEFVCPMDPEVRSKTPGKCPRCGMTLEANIPEPVAYPTRFKFDPPQIPAQRNVRLQIQVSDPTTGKPVKEFHIVHEKQIHLFIVSENLEFFAHEHPDLGPDGVFRYDMTLPRSGTYKLLADFYPQGGTPQLIPYVITTAGYTRSLRASITRPEVDLSPKHGENMDVELSVEPAQPLAGKKTMLFFRLNPSDGLEPYLGAWSHMLAASNDLVDTMHSHPVYMTRAPDGRAQVQFNLFFPRAAIYRVWVQFQRKGRVNTAAFTIPVTKLR
jgi:hypothetical protein